MSNATALLEQAQRVTQRVCGELRNAHLVWAHFEAINGETNGDRAELRAGISKLGLVYTFDALRLAVVRDTVMSVFRVSDASRPDRLTLPRLSRLLESDALREECMAAARSWPGSTFPELRTKNEGTCAAAMQAIRDAAPPEWIDEAPPADRRLFDLRNSLRKVRSGSLAHALEGSSGNVVIDEIRDFLSVTAELAAHAEMAVLGTAAMWTHEQRIRLREANEFWDCCQKGF